ncbi:excise [Mycobacterium phage Archie]|uniref:Excise n=1 Tax=Mycobacterium phage Archie TaxID=1718599 RepID=A0A0M4QZT9_9CAUD|nr:HTH DNA binding protein [Mycobacterium phage Archie]ALF00348.1 excise [Mycobacterium phage Archie]
MTANTALLSDEPDRLLVTRPEAARILGLSVPEIDRLRHKGKLLAKKHGSKVLFPMKELERFANDLPWELDQ